MPSHTATVMARFPALTRTLRAQPGLTETQVHALPPDLAGAAGIACSLAIYDQPEPAAQLDAFHRRFLDPGDIYASLEPWRIRGAGNPWPSAPRRCCAVRCSCP